MKLRILGALALACACLGVATPARAQGVTDPFETARYRFGVIRFTPSILITSVGHDSNVFNEADDPKSDTTAAIGPTVQLWMRPGNTRLSARLGAQYLYFKEFDSQRGWNTSNEARWDVQFARITPFVAGSYVNTRDRQGYEIDSRARRIDDSITLGSTLRLSGKSSFVVSFRRFNAEYDETESFQGAALAEALNRREETARVQYRHALTPLTTLVVETDLARDRFELNNLRDSDSLKVMPGFELKPLALISGRVFAGFRQFKPLAAGLPDYRGVVAAVDATYVRGSTRFQARVDRDLAYSFEPTRPYYALLDAGLVVTQRLTSAWDVVGRGSRQRLDYRQLDASPVPAEQGDSGYSYGVGLGYRLAETFRLGLDANYYTRRSEFAERREYDGLRVFGSISYGIPQ